MKKNKNYLLDVQFNELSKEQKMFVLCIDVSIFTIPRFRGVNEDIVINDLWNGKTNSQKRTLLKGLK